MSQQAVDDKRKKLEIGQVSTFITMFFLTIKII